MGVACTKTLSRVNKCMRHHVMENRGEGGVERGEGTAGEGRMGREDVGRRRRLAWCGGVAWCGVVWYVLVWCGVVWCGAATGGLPAGLYALRPGSRYS